MITDLGTPKIDNKYCNKESKTSGSKSDDESGNLNKNTATIGGSPTHICLRTEANT